MENHAKNCSDRLQDIGLNGAIQKNCRWAKPVGELQLLPIMYSGNGKT